MKFFVPSTIFISIVFCSLTPFSRAVDGDESSSTARKPLDYLKLCSMQSAPQRTDMVDTHGVSFYSYPEDIPDNFSGCRYMWLEDGTKLYSLYYLRGEIVWTRGNEPGEDESICYYVQDKLDMKKSKNPGGCRLK
jgi:hypothetical protein